MIKEHFDSKSGFLLSYWEEDVTLPEIVEYIKRTKANVAYPRKLKILTDASKANLMITPDDLDIISDENKLSVANYDSIIDAFVVDEALVAALTSMYQRVSSAENYKFKIFSSLEAGTQWLDRF